MEAGQYQDKVSEKIGQFFVHFLSGKGNVKVGNDWLGCVTCSKDEHHIDLLYGHNFLYIIMHLRWYLMQLKYNTKVTFLHEEFVFRWFKLVRNHIVSDTHKGTRKKRTTVILCVLLPPSRTSVRVTLTNKEMENSKKEIT